MQDRADGDGIAVGTELNGVYAIDERIATAGEFYRAHNILTDDPVAIEMIAPAILGDAATLSAFKREAGLLFNLNHEAIVRYYMFSVDPSLGRAYLAMEYVAGPSLGDALASGPLDAGSARILVDRIGSALAAAHRLGIVHHDVSPQKIILPDGDVHRAKLIDFGIARPLTGSGTIVAGTVVGGGLAGREAYAAPEEFGLAGGVVTGKSDIYSLGLVIAEALRGAPIDMGGSYVEMIEKRRRVPDLRDIDPSLQPLLTAMLDPEPAARPADPATFGEAPELPAFQPVLAANELPMDRGVPASLLADAVAAGPAPSAVPMPLRQPPRRGAGGWYVAVLIVLLVAGGAGYTLFATPFGEKLLHGGAPARETASAPAAAPSTPPPSPAIVVEAPAPAAPPAVAAPSPAPPASQPAGPAAPTVSPPSSGASPSAGPSLRAGEIVGALEAQLPKPATPVSPPAVPTVPAKAEVPPPSLADLVRAFDGGDCFFAAEAERTGAPPLLDGFATGPEAFDRLGKAVGERLHVDPAATLHEVAKPQCPAVDVAAAAPVAAVRPTIRLDHDKMGQGKTLSGKVAGLAGRKLSLLLVTNDGTVVKLDTKGEGADGASFSMPMSADDNSVGAPQLLMAVAANEPLPSLAALESAPAADWLKEFAGDLKGTHATGIGLATFRIVQ